MVTVTYESTLISFKTFVMNCLGGKSDPGYQSSGDKWVAQNFQPINPLPMETFRHCIHTINSTHGILVGGRRYE